MDSFEINKILGAGLLAATVLLGTSILTEGLFHQDAPEKPGWDIEVAEEGSAPGAEKEVEKEPSIAVLLASADAEKGAKVAKKCASCHDFSQGGANKTGPALYNIIGSKMGAKEGFKYSEALLAYGADKTWTFEEMNGFMKKPKDHIPGTTMGFAGLKKPEDRANIIAYLTSLSESPVPFPEPEAEPAESEGQPTDDAATPADNAADAVEETVQDVQDTAAEAADAVGEAVKDAAQDSQEGLEQAVDAVKENVESATDAAVEVIDDQPASASEAVSEGSLPQ